MPFFLSIPAALFPALLLMYFFYKRDLHPEPHDVLWGTFFRGVGTVFLVLVIAGPALFFTPLFDTSPLALSFFTAFVSAALAEEFFKYWVVTKYCAEHPAFDEPMDGVVYGAIASLGFAALENIIYVAQGGWTTAILRSFTAVPMHACFGAIMGYYISKDLFGDSTDKHPAKRPFMSSHKALWIAVLLHGLYDLPLMYLSNLHKAGAFSKGSQALSQDQQSIVIFGCIGFVLAVVLVCFVWTWRIVAKLRRQQDSKKHFPIE